MSGKSQALWYVAGFLLALFWKYFCWVYIGMFRLKKGFAVSSREWFEMTTIDAKVSWIATVALVWTIGTVYVKQIGIAWLFGGVLAGVPVCDPIAFLLGVTAEYTAPALLKYFCSKIPFAKMPE